MTSMAMVEGHDLTLIIVQVTGIVCEALRLVMVQRLLSSDEFKMDPLVSVYCETLFCPYFRLFYYTSCQHFFVSGYYCPTSGL